MIPSLSTLLKEGFSQALFNAFPGLLPLQDELPIEIAESQFADYQFNSAMKWAKKLNVAPRTVATTLLEHLPANLKEMIQDTSIAGPGFINITLKEDWLQKHLALIMETKNFGLTTDQPQRIVIDFSSPNIAKEMHVGHLRSTIIGDCLARLFETLGNDVLRLNHIGDWGTAFGMLIAYLKEQKPDLEKSVLSDLTLWYRTAKERFDSDAAFKKQSQLQVVALQSGEKEARELWKRICAISSAAYQEIYDLLEIRLQDRGESFYQPWLPFVVEDAEKKGHLVISDGAKCLFIPGIEQPFMLQKSDGGYTYATTDLACLYHRIQEERADRIIIVTDAGQSSHFALLFECGKLMEYWDPSKTRLDHVPFGLVLGPDGKKFKTRSGHTERLIDLLTSAIDQARALLQARENPPDDIEAAAIALGMNAVKYADLSCQRTHDYSFSYERMLRFEGNTAAFLMYSLVRTLSIQKRVGKDVAIIPWDTLHISHPSERALVLHLLRFQERAEILADDLMPHRLCEYLYQLAEKFNAFFRDCHVANTQEEASRLLLCRATERILQLGMHILGLKVIDRM